MNKDHLPLAGLALSMLLSSLGTSIANVALPTIAHDFGASFRAVQWVVLAYLLAITTLIVSVGRLGDLIGRRRLLLAGLCLFTAASALCSLAPTLGLLVAARVAQGMGAAVMLALTMAFVATTVAPERTGRAMGLLGTMSAVGTALGPSLGGALLAGFGWPAIFWVNVPLGVASVVLVCRYLPRDRSRANAARLRFDYAGTLLLALALGGYAMALSVGRGAIAALCVLLMATAGLLFVRVQLRAAAPLIPLALLKNGGISAACGMSTLVTTVVMATLVVGPFYLVGALALDALRVGLVMSAGPIVAALTGVPAGRLVDRFGAPRMTVAGLIAMALGCVLLPLLPTGLGVAAYVVPLCVMTAGYGLFQAANNTAVMSAGAADQRGVVSGLLNLARNLGLITGASAMGALFAAGAAGGNVVAGMRLTFGVATVLIMLAIAIASAHRHKKSASPGSAF